MFLHKITIPESMIRKLNLHDEYSLHKVVYNQFPLNRTTEQMLNTPSGIQWKELQDGFRSKNLLVLSDREIVPTEGLIIQSKAVPDKYFSRPQYKFEITTNPTTQKGNKRTAITNKNEIIEWFKRITTDLGFSIVNVQVDLVSTSKFKKKNTLIKLVKADLSGVLSVTDHDKFKNTVSKGIGRSRTFGCGLLQITPIA